MGGEYRLDIQAYWDAVLRQDAAAIQGYFHPSALIRWHNTKEQFTVAEFIRANCEYPGEWDGKIERVEESGSLLITAAQVYTRDRTLSFHVVSFIRVENGRIVSLDEYWGDDTAAPQWRQDLRIGTSLP